MFINLSNAQLVRVIEELKERTSNLEKQRVWCIAYVFSVYFSTWKY